jgi:hypothetical protein
MKQHRILLFIIGREKRELERNGLLAMSQQKFDQGRLVISCPNLTFTKLHFLVVSISINESMGLLGLFEKVDIKDLEVKVLNITSC